MRKFAITLAAAALAGGAVVAVNAQGGPSAPGALEPSRVSAGTYTADAGHSLVGWTVSHFGFNDYFGIFGDVKGTLTLDPTKIESASVDVSIPVSKLTTPNAGLTAHMLRDGKDGAPADFFGSAPADATFKSTSVKQTGATTAAVTGNLTLNGVTKPVTVNAEFSGAGKHPFSQKETVGFRGTAKIKRSDFGVNYGLAFVTDEVALNITIAFEK
jgi:polyisoprenoid-binding protein YceI